MNSIERFAASHGGVSVLSALDSERISGSVAEAFVDDPGRRWWWEGLRQPSRAIDYGEDDGIEHLRGLLSGVQEPITMMESPPWIAVRGELPKLVDLLREHQYFEYFLVDESFRWIVFDTHHNTLVVCGEIPP